MMVEVLDSRVQAQKFLSAFPSPESLLTALLSPCGTVGLFNDVVTPGCGDHLLVVDVDQTWDLSDRGAITLELVGMDNLWDIVFSQQPGQEDLRHFGVPMPLKQDVEYEAVLVDCSPEPMSDPIDARTDCIHMPLGTPIRFPVA